MILGAVLFDPVTALAIAVDQELAADHFYLKRHAEVFRICLECYHKGNLPNFGLVAAELEQQGKLEEMGGRNFITSLIEFTAPTLSVEANIRKVIDDARRRQAIRSYQQAAADLHDSQKDFSQVCDQVSQQVYSLSQESRSRYAMRPIGQTMADVILDLESQDEPFLSTGIREFDRKVGGFTPGYWVAGGRTSMGKTHFGLNLVYAMASRHNKPALFISCEMNARSIGQRLLARQSRIDSSRIRKKQIADHEWEALGEASTALAAMPIEIYPHPNPTEIEIRQKIRQVCDQYGEPPKLIMVDYLQKLWWHNDRNRAEDLGKISQALYTISQDFDTTVVSLVQINRGINARADKRPTESDIKDCGNVEQDADLIMLLYRDEFYNPNSTDTGVTELIIPKNRNGTTGTIRLLHELKYGNYLEEVKILGNR